MEIGNETTTRFSTPPPSSASTKIRLRMIHGTLARVRNGLGKIGAVPRKQHIALWHGNVGSENGGEGRLKMWFFSAKKKSSEVPHFSRNPCVCSHDCWISISGSTGASRMGASKPERNPGSFWVLDCLANVELLFSIDFDGWFEILSDTLWSFFL